MMRLHLDVCFPLFVLLPNKDYVESVQNETTNIFLQAVNQGQAKEY